MSPSWQAGLPQGQSAVPDQGGTGPGAGSSKGREIEGPRLTALRDHRYGHSLNLRIQRWEYYGLGQAPVNPQGHQGQTVDISQVMTEQTVRG